MRAQLSYLSISIYKYNKLGRKAIEQTLLMKKKTKRITQHKEANMTRHVKCIYKDS